MNAPFPRPAAAAPALRYLSVCSGIESASVAWEPLGFQPIAFAEIAAFPSRVLAHHWPHVPNLGDFTAIDTVALGPVDLLVGGTPCQAFSVAGRRLSLADARGNLSLAFGVLAHELACGNGLRWALWENVPGVLSRGDNAFGCILGQLVGADAALPLPRGAERWPDAGLVAGPRARAAWRILDAQHFGLPQRRRRVFVVVGFGDGADPAAVLFEPRGLRRDSPARGKPRTLVAGALAPGSGGGCGPDDNDARAHHLIAHALAAHGGPHGRLDKSGETFVACCAGTLVAGGNHTGGARYVGTSAETASTMLVAHTLRGAGFEDGSDRGSPIVPFDTTQVTHCENRCNPQASDPCHPLAAGAHPPAIAFQQGGSNVGICDEVFGTMRAGDGQASGGAPCIAFDCKAGGDTGFSIGALPGTLRGTGHGGGHAAVALVGDSAWAVRRLTPTECHRLQGFPDGHALIPGAKDGPVYMALGNAKPVPVVRWLGARIAAADAAAREARA